MNLEEIIKHEPKGTLEFKNGSKITFNSLDFSSTVETTKEKKLEPRKEFLEKRLKKLSGAIKSKIKSKKLFPIEWFSEYNGICIELEMDSSEETETEN